MSYISRDSLEDLIGRDDFRPFKIITAAGLGYDVPSPHNIALGKSEFFYYFPKSDRSIHVPYSHIATVEESGAKSSSKRS